VHYYRHWPAGFERAMVDLFAHNDLTINPSCERVWSRIICSTVLSSGNEGLELFLGRQPL